jgi:serpin B
MTEHEDEARIAESTRSTLRVLTRRTPVTTGWRAGDTVRRTVVIRRRWRWGAGAATVLLAAAVTALSLTTGDSGGRGGGAPLAGSVHTAGRIGSAVQLAAETAPITRADPAAVDSVAAAEQALSIALLRQVSDGGNVSVSPASLYLALGMLQNAARGETAAQISHALQASGISTAEQNAGLAGLTDELDAAAAQDGIALDSANSLWQLRGFDIRAKFLQTLAAYYHAGVWKVDYARDMAGALKAINDWTAQQTHGKIQKLFDQLDPATVLVLANAIYFHATWATPFDEARTVPGTFVTADGKQVLAKFMSGGSALHSAITGGYRAVELPYRGGRFAALAIMPSGGSLADFVQSLTPDRISAIAGSLRSGTQVKLPRFTTTSKIDLKPVLQALGMTTAFTDSADLSGLSDAVSTKVDQVIQRVYLGVGEKGTTAAAVTGISILPTSVTPERYVVFDHPFLFLVRDTETGAILFASEVRDPTAG